MSREWEFIVARLEIIETRMVEQHQRLRVDMYAGFDKVAAKLEEHRRDDDLVDARVLIIETQRAEESKLTVRRGTWAGLFAAFGLTAVWEMVQRLWKP